MGTTFDGRYKRRSVAGPRTHIAVSSGIHDVIRLYAYQRNLSIREATERLIKIAVGIIYGEQMPQSPAPKAEQSPPDKG